MKSMHYARTQPGEIWHILDPRPIWLVTFCEQLMGTNPREKHTDVTPKGAHVCQRCLTKVLALV